jgi:hypothetical protein
MAATDRGNKAAYVLRPQTFRLRAQLDTSAYMVNNICDCSLRAVRSFRSARFDDLGCNI